MNEPDSTFKSEGGAPTAYENPERASEKTGPASPFENTKTHMRHSADNLKTAARSAVEEWRGKAEQVAGDAQERIRSLPEQSKRYVRENPTKAIISVLGIGILLGLIIRR